MKKIFIDSSFLPYAKGLESLKTGNIKLGCYRDKWSYREDLRISYVEIEVEEGILYISGDNGHFLQKMGGLFIHKIGTLPKKSTSKNTLFV